MNGSPVWLAVLLAWLWLACGCAAAAAQARIEDLPTSPIVYDIPAQDLAAALGAYAAASGTQVLFETALTAGRISNPVKGRLTPEAALQALLSGTGLARRRTDVDAITIVPDRRVPPAPAAVAPGPRFLGALQTAILATLCRNPLTRPGPYRMALQLWIRPAGLIERAALLSTTGDGQRDAALAGALAGIAIGERPPARMSQPVTLVIVPRSPFQPPECEAGGQIP